MNRAFLIFDAHCDTLIPVLRGTRQLGEQSDQGHIDLPRLREGRVTAQTFAIYHDWRRLRQRATAEALRSVEGFYEQLEAYPTQLTLATRAAHIEAAWREGQVAGVLSLEGAEPLAGDRRILRVFHRLGIRMITLTWNYRNAVADGVGVAGGQRGLSETGKALVREMNRLGILVDIAHLAPRGVADVLRISERPVIASHVGARALCDHPRNLTDAQIEGVARTGGVVCVTLVPAFLAEGGQGADRDRFLDHVEHCLRVAGADHVGLGSDFDGYRGVTLGMEDTRCWPSVIEGLRTRGYSDEVIGKVMGQNLLRVFRQVAG